MIVLTLTLITFIYMTDTQRLVTRKGYIPLMAYFTA